MAKTIIEGEVDSVCKYEEGSGQKMAVYLEGYDWV